MNKYTSLGFWRLSGIIPLVLILNACSSAVPEMIRKAPTSSNPLPTEVILQLERFRAQSIRWGGVIISTHNLSQSTEITILAMPLDQDGEPRSRAPSLGRFIARFSQFMEPSIYASGRQLTVLGKLDRIDSLKVGEYDYPHPVLKVEHHYLWPIPVQTHDHDWPPFWYDPWYYPYYPYPHRPRRP